MLRTTRVLCVLGFVLLMATPAYGFNGFFRGLFGRTAGSSPVTSYYYPATSYYYYPATSYYYYPATSYYVPSYYYTPTVVTESIPIVPTVPTIVCPSTETVEPQTYAQPVPAGPRPSRIIQPPKTETGKDNPNIRVQETNERYYRGSPISTQADTIRVGFWNTTNRTVVLRVDGITRTIRGKGGATLDLPRSFTWQIDQEPAETETLSSNRRSYEIFIR